MLPRPRVIFILIRHGKQINGRIGDARAKGVKCSRCCRVWVCAAAVLKCKRPKSFRSHRVTLRANTESLLLQYSCKH